jgi:hypothetical protein
MEEMRQAKFHNSHPHGTTAPRGPGPPHYRFCTITLRHTKFGRTPLDEGSAPRTDVYLATHNTHHRHTCMSPAGFEHTIPADLRLRPHGHRDRQPAKFNVTCYEFYDKYHEKNEICHSRTHDRHHRRLCSPGWALAFSSNYRQRPLSWAAASQFRQPSFIASSFPPSVPLDIGRPRPR